MDKLKVGDVVNLASGSPDMTVSQIWNDGITVECKWFVNSLPVKYTFFIAELSKQ